MDDLTERLARLTPDAPADAALAAIRADAARHRRQRTALVAMVAVLALVAGTTVLLGGGGDEGAVDPADDEQVDGVQVDADGLVPAVFDGRPRLDPLRALPDCDRHDELEAWATNILDADYAAIEAQEGALSPGPPPTGPMEVTTLDHVAATSPVLVAEEDGGPAACITALAGPNDLVAWEQRSADGILLARGVAAPWRSAARPAARTTPAERQWYLAEATGKPHDAQRSAVPGRLAAGGGLGIHARAVIRSSVPGLALALDRDLDAAGVGHRGEVEVLVGAGAAAWGDTSGLLSVADSISYVTSPWMLGSEIAARLVLLDGEPDEVLASPTAPTRVPAGWVLCGHGDSFAHLHGSVSTIDGRQSDARVETIWCGPDGARMLAGSVERAASPDDIPIDATVRSSASARERRRTVAVDVLHAGIGDPSFITVAMSAPDSMPLTTLEAVLRSVPVVAEAPVERTIPPGPEEAPTLAELRATLGRGGSRLLDLAFLMGAGGPEDDARSAATASLRADLLGGDRPVAITIAERPATERWWLTPASSTGEERVVGGVRVLVSDAPPGAGAVVETRCGRWRINLTGPEQVSDADVAIWEADRDQLAAELLVELTNAFGCDSSDAATVTDDAGGG